MRRRHDRTSRLFHGLLKNIFRKDTLFLAGAVVKKCFFASYPHNTAILPAMAGTERTLGHVPANDDPLCTGCVKCDLCSKVHHGSDRLSKKIELIFLLFFMFVILYLL
jgi:hypothetical protein